MLFFQFFFAKRLEKYGIQVLQIDAEKLIEKHNIDVIISPANSFGFMDGGIDKVYMKMFDGIQSTVQNKIEKIGYLYFTAGTILNDTIYK